MLHTRLKGPKSNSGFANWVLKVLVVSVTPILQMLFTLKPVDLGSALIGVSGKY